MFTRAWPEHAGCELLADGAGKTTTQGLRHAPKQITPFRPSAHRPDGDSIEPRAKEVKKESLMERIKPIGVSDFRSKREWDTAQKRGAAGGGAGRSWAWGDGGADIRGGLRGPEHIASLPASCGDVDRPLGTFSASTKVLERCFAASSLTRLSLAATGGSDKDKLQHMALTCPQD
jgi:hypothetical protein